MIIRQVKEQSDLGLKSASVTAHDIDQQWARDKDSKSESLTKVVKSPLHWCCWKDQLLQLESPLLGLQRLFEDDKPWRILWKIW